MTTTLLQASTDTQELTRSSRSALLGEAHERFSNALNGFVAPLIGFSVLLLGGFSRFGIWRQIIGAIVALIIIQMLTQAGQGVVRRDAAAWPLAYVGPLVGFAFSAAMLTLASRPGLFRSRRRDT